jgi:hypothetical protein
MNYPTRNHEVSYSSPHSIALPGQKEHPVNKLQGIIKLKNGKKQKIF